MKIQILVTYVKSCKNSPVNDTSAELVITDMIDMNSKMAYQVPISSHDLGIGRLVKCVNFQASTFNSIEKNKDNKQNKH